MEKYLRRCLDSLIVKENFEMLEVWVVNDGSKDNSSAIAHEYADKYPTVFYVIDKPNGNYGSCINAALPRCTGKYVKVLDSDDWFYTKSLQDYLKTLHDFVEIDMFVTNYSEVYGGKNKIVDRNAINCDFLEIYDFAKYDFAQNKNEHMLVMHAITYRTQFLRDINYMQQTGISYTDIEFDLIPMEFIQKFAFVDLNLYQYLLGREGQTVSQGVSSKSLGAYQKIYNRLIVTFINITKKNEQIRVNNARCVFVKLLMSLFSTALVFNQKTKGLNDYLLGVCDTIKDVDLVLIKKLRNAKYYKVNYFAIWERTGVYISNKAIMFLIQIVKSLKGK